MTKAKTNPKTPKYTPEQLKHFTPEQIESKRRGVWYMAIGVVLFASGSLFDMLRM